MVKRQIAPAITPGLAVGGYSPSCCLAFHRVKDLLNLVNITLFAIFSWRNRQAEDRVA
ncbi:hypothetical protein FOPG_06036 [Fusarium oxysporum f. sp. conglutinans race 2 54008]|uniref:Uncharacterized protein n=1 Tax=Fusarium oxysporum f. sp. conglutinans race 2 54008 TaxID=1089457 RepID=X0J5G2_FUSOX|nr:hypothetical protein FOPG_06036 [Fusarium oxysporum f. sp. conglutinans race 2 54008]